MEASEEPLRRKVILLHALTGLSPDCLGGLGRQQEVDAESAPKLEMGPIVEGIAKSVRDGGCPSIEFLTISGVSGDVAFGDAIGSHCPPLIMVVPEPDIGGILPTMVFANLARGKVSVVVENRLLRCGLMVEMTRRLASEEKILIEIIGHCSSEDDKSSGKTQGKAAGAGHFDRSLWVTYRQSVSVLKTWFELNEASVMRFPVKNADSA